LLHLSLHKTSAENLRHGLTNTAKEDSDPSSKKDIPLNCLVQYVVRVCLHPATALDPRVPEHLDLLRDGPEPLLQRRHAVVRLLRTDDRRNACEPRRDVAVVHPGFGPGDEWALGDRGRERHDGKLLNAVPESSGLSEKVLLRLVRHLAGEERFDAGDLGDLRVVERLVCLSLRRCRVLL